jgi:hypothetical protein
VSLSRTDADGSGLTRNSSVADIDVVIARGEINAGLRAHSDVVAAGIVLERISTIGRVIAAGCVAIERIKTVGRVEVAVVLLKRAPLPLAALPPPVVFSRSA